MEINTNSCFAKTYRLQKVYLGKNFAEHMQAHQDVSLEHIKEALENLKVLVKNFYIGTVDLKRVVGKQTCVEITDENRDKVQMLYRKGRKGRTPILLEGEGVDTTCITIGIAKDDKNKFRLFTAWYGTKATREPWDRNIESETELKECEEFWSKHAIIADFNSINWERSREAV